MNALPSSKETSVKLINVPNVTRTLGATTETVYAWRDGSVMARPARRKKEEDHLGLVPVLVSPILVKTVASA